MRHFPRRDLVAFATAAGTWGPVSLIVDSADATGAVPSKTIRGTFATTWPAR